MPSIVFLIAAYLIVSLALILYVVMLRRQWATLMRQLDEDA